LYQSRCGAGCEYCTFGGEFYGGLGAGFVAGGVALEVEDEYQDEGVCCWAFGFGAFVRSSPLSFLPLKYLGI
jgi:hypothetical protein